MYNSALLWSLPVESTLPRLVDASSTLMLSHASPCSLNISLYMLHNGGRTIFKGGGGRIWKSKLARQHRLLRLRDAGGFLRGDVPPPSEVSWSLFENVVLTLVLPKGVVTTPLTVCLRNAKESDPGHLGHLFYILCGDFDEKKNRGVPLRWG